MRRDALRGERVLYSAIAGGRDVARSAAALPNWRRVLYTDGPSAPGWETRPIEASDTDPARTAKVFKVLPHRFFPAAEYSLWIDGNIVPDCDLNGLVDRYLTRCDIAVHRHPERRCIYDEADTCIALGLDSADVIGAQMDRYRRAGHPASAGLAALGVVLRRHTASVRTLNERWWREIQHGSRRDQLSFDVVARMTGLSYATFESHYFEGPLFRYYPHASVPAG